MDNLNDYEIIPIGKAENLTNQIFGHWKVLYRTTNNNQGKVRWVCQCDCEKQTVKAVDAKSLKSGTSTNCGCVRLNTISKNADKKIHKRDQKGNIILKKCFRCGKWLPLDSFWKSNSQKDGYCGECKNCSLYSKESKFNIYKKNAKKRNFDFSLTKDEFYNLINQDCYYCGEVPNPYNGIDRINSAEGYYLDNCVPCCEMCNKMKLDYSIEEWYNHMKKILEHIGEFNV